MKKLEIADLSLFSADMVILNANIITMDPRRPHADAVAIKNGRIIGIGRDSEIKEYCGMKTKKIDLKGKTLLPGFIESHNHMIMYAANVLGVDCRISATPSIEDILVKIKEKTESLPEGTWIEGWGYDDTMLKEMRHPTRYDLDKVAPNHPVIVTHVSGHLCAVNSYALKMAGINKETKDPEGGRIYRDSNLEPTGVLAELPALSMVMTLIPPKTVDELIGGLKIANKVYHEAGVTTIHDAGVGIQGENELIAYLKAVENKDICIRINAMIYYELLEKLASEGGIENLGFCTKCGDEWFKIGAVKIVQDGSIQGLTGALFDPYLVDPSEKGTLIYSQEKLTELILKFHKQGFQIAVHGNGDRAIDSIIKAYESALYVLPREDHRHRIEHCQMVHDDQLAKMAELGINASFFPIHVNYWGDRHRDIFIGPKRASRIDPLKSAVKQGIIIGLHTDCPITPISPLNCLYSAVARETLNGDILGKEERLTVTEALRALTIDAAVLGFEEHVKGSVELGKYADFVALSENPYEISPTELKDLKVDLTIIDGKIVYKRY